MTMTYVELVEHIAVIRTDLTSGTQPKTEKRKQLQAVVAGLANHSAFNVDEYGTEYQEATTTRSWDKCYAAVGELLAGIQPYNRPTLPAGRTFAYCRVSTTEQTTDNQVLAIKAKGYAIQPGRVVEETVSGSIPAMQRNGFKTMIEHKLEAGDTLVVLKLDRLGRDSIDVQATVQMLMGKGINVVCLDLPTPNLSSAEGKMMLQMFMAFAEFERNRIIERTKEGQARAKAQGKSIGRPVAEGTTEDVQKCKANGLSQSKTAKALKISLATVKRHWNKG